MPTSAAAAAPTTIRQLSNSRANNNNKTLEQQYGALPNELVMGPRSPFCFCPLALPAQHKCIHSPLQCTIGHCVPTWWSCYQVSRARRGLVQTRVQSGANWCNVFFCIHHVKSFVVHVLTSITFDVSSGCVVVCLHQP